MWSPNIFQTGYSLILLAVLLTARQLGLSWIWIIPVTLAILLIGYLFSFHRNQHDNGM